MNRFKAAWDHAVEWVEGEDRPDELVYDPVHLIGVVTGCLCALGGLFWLLWSLLVFEGGLFTKIGPALQVLFTSKMPADFGYDGAPYRMGVFEGWWVNLTAFALSVALVAGVRWLLRPERKR